jgi:hypothetical protein
MGTIGVAERLGMHDEIERHHAGRPDLAYTGATAGEQRSRRATTRPGFARRAGGGHLPESSPLGPWSLMLEHFGPA